MTLGEQNLDFQISKFNANAQPYYVVLDPRDSVHRPLITPVAYEPDVAQFGAFLRAGLAQYRSPQSPLALR